jgi:hypothetical protein
MSGSSGVTSNPTQRLDSIGKSRSQADGRQSDDNRQNQPEQTPGHFFVLPMPGNQHSPGDSTVADGFEAASNFDPLPAPCYKADALEAKSAIPSLEFRLQAAGHWL